MYYSMFNFKMYISLPPTDVSCRNISLRLVPIFGGGFGTSKSVGMATVVRVFLYYQQTFLPQNGHYTSEHFCLSHLHRV